jgi:hypothetical protein
MSYCRWSSDDYQCDVYVYEGEYGFVIHVAGRRRIFTEGVLPPPLPEGASVEEWTARYMLVSELVSDESKWAWREFDMPSTFETFNDASPGACADRLEALRVEGFNVPQYAINLLREEPHPG